MTHQDKIKIGDIYSYTWNLDGAFSGKVAGESRYLVVKDMGIDPYYETRDAKYDTRHLWSVYNITTSKLIVRWTKWMVFRRGKKI